MGRARLRRDERRSEAVRLYFRPPYMAALKALAREDGLDVRLWLYRAIEGARAAQEAREPAGAASA